MCIIVAKNKGVKIPNRTILRTCFMHNSDGAGFMYNYKGQVIIQKGFMKWADFDKALTKVEKLLKNTTKYGMVFHFRITTQGGTNPMNCHPFPISRYDYELQQTYINTDVGVVHNGIIDLTSYSAVYDYKTKTYTTPSLKLSDTQIFIRDYMTDIYDLNNEFYKYEVGLDLIQTLIDSKMAFLDKNGLITTTGTFNVCDDVLYSNYSYEEVKYSALQNNKYYDDFSVLYDDVNYDSAFKSITTPIIGIEDKISIMPIEVDGFWWNSSDGSGDLASGKFGLDDAGLLYQIDKFTKECIRFASKYVTVYSINGDEIDYDKTKAELYNDLEYIDA